MSNDEILTTIFDTLAKYYIYNVIVVANNKTLTYYPYKYENMRNPLLTYEEITTLDYFPNKLPKLWRNTTITTCYVFMPPYYLGDIRNGSDVILVESILKPRLRMSTNMSESTFWGTKLRNGAYIGGMGDLKSKKADIVLGGAMFTHSDTYDDFDTTTPYYDDAALWLVPIALEYTSLVHLVMVFTRETFMLILITSACLTIAWIFIPRCLPVKYPYYLSIWNVSTKILRNFCGNVEQHSSQSIQLKCLHITTLFFVITIAAAFSGALFGNLTTPVYERQISTVQDVIDSKLIITMSSVMRNTYYGFTDKKKQYIYNVTVQVDDAVEMDAILKRIAVKRDITGFASRRNMEIQNVVKGISSSKFAVAHPNPTMFALVDGQEPFSIIIILQKGHPMFEQIKKIMVIVFETGIYEKISNEFRYYIYLKQFKREPAKGGHKAIRFDQIQGIFYCWIGALFIALVVFCGEIIYYRVIDYRCLMLELFVVL
ncbi:uncharacterized protein [Atheta coriaria]|uniref:uncharacterized protein n=1 Tax=Dalotia coriaria TaxID=877792 RepID=UPI0031F44A66